MLPGWITVKPLLWAILALLLVITGQAVMLKLAHADVATAVAAQATAEGALKVRTDERDAFAARVDELASSNGAWSDAVEQVSAELKQAQRDYHALQQQSRAAIADARAAAADADRTLKRFVAQFATESRRPACAQALNQLEAACPALSDY